MKTLYLSPKANNQTIKKFHLIAVGVTVAAAAAVLFWADPVTRPVAFGHLTFSQLQSGGGYDVFITAAKNFFDVRIDYLLALTLAVAAVLHARLALRVREQYEAKLKSGVTVDRWVGLAVVGSLSLLTLGLLSGIQDKVTLTAIVALTVLASLLGWANETWNKLTKKPSRPLLWLGLMAGLVPVLMVVAYGVGSVWFGQTRLPYALYAAYGGLMLVLAGLAFNHRLALKTKPNKFAPVELNYAGLSLALVVITAAGVTLSILG